MNRNEIEDKFKQLIKNVKLADVPFDIVRDPITDFLYDKTVQSDIIKAKEKRALVELMKTYRPDLDVGWDKYLTKLNQSFYRKEAVELFSSGDFKGIEMWVLYNWSKQLKIDCIEDLLKPKSYNVFIFDFLSDFVNEYGETKNINKTFINYGLSCNDEEFIKDAMFIIMRAVSERKTKFKSPKEREIKEKELSRYIKEVDKTDLMYRTNDYFKASDRDLRSII